MGSENGVVSHRVPWNKGKLTGQKPPLKLREIWAIRTRLQMTSNVRELAMFNLQLIASFERAILRGCRYKTFVTEATWLRGLQSCSKRHSGLSNSRSRN
jgi:hypothetical protein